MKSTIITVDIRTCPGLPDEYMGTIFRGWLGSALICKEHVPAVTCAEKEQCPYYLIFKERIDVKPYSLLSFKAGDLIRGFIKIHGDRERYVPDIVSRINEHSHAIHFKGHDYSVDSISVKKNEPAQGEWGDRIRFQSLSPIYLEKKERMEILPDLSLILAASVRAYNRVTKYYARDQYPYRVPSGLLDAYAPILDYNIKTVQILHKTMDGRRIALKGIVGNILYDTSAVPPEAAEILNLGSYLQIGKHSTYGFGGFMVRSEV